MSQWIDFKQLRSQLRITDVLEHYQVQLKIRGDRATGFCPLPGHHGRRENGGKRHSPSFSCNLSKGLFQCFSCGAKGNAVDLVVCLEGLDPNDPAQFRQGALRAYELFVQRSARPTLQRKNGRLSKAAPQPEAPSAIASNLPVAVNAPLEFALQQLDPSHPYLASRGFTPQTIERFGLGFCHKGLMKDRIAIPLFDPNGALVGYAGRLVDDALVTPDRSKYLFPGTRTREKVIHELHKGEFLYNGAGLAKAGGDVVVVEGFASVWWLHQHGKDRVVALMGSSVSVRQAQLLINLLGLNGRLWILTDGDEPGERCANELFQCVGPHRFVHWARLKNGQPTDLSSNMLHELLHEF